MELSPDQQAAARARGLAFLPATDERVRSLTMQRRIFWLDGQPFLATRDGAYYETHATLAALIAGYEPEAPARGAEAAAAPAEAQAVPALDPEEPTAADGESAGPDARRDESDTPYPRPRKPRTPRPRPGPASARSGAVNTSGMAAESPDAEEAAMGPGAAEHDGTARVVRRRRAGQPKTPRWIVAGKMRRGRLKK